MADYLQEVNTIIEAGTTEAGSTDADWPIYRGFLPDSTVIGDRAVALLHTAGESNIGGTDGARAEIEGPGLQVVVRGLPLNQFSTSYVEAEEIAVAVENALHGFTGNSSTGGRHYVGIWNESGPFFLGLDESKRPLFSTNFRVLRSRT